MKNVAHKIGPQNKPSLHVIKTAASESWLRSAFRFLVIAKDKMLEPKPDPEAWRRLEFRNEYAHERRKERDAWRI